MGLDMYLSAHLSGWDHSTPAERQEFNRALGKVTEFVASGAPSGYLEFHVAYWRKANQIHRWFVETVQNGTDDCGKYGVSREQLKELVDLCKKVLANPPDAPEALPAKAGFFFGGTDYDEYYLDDLKETVAQLDKALTLPAQWKFVYHSSW